MGISNDIAVLEFASSLTLNEYVVPAKLPAHTEGEWMSENDVIHVCGWGNTLVIGSNYPAELHCVDTLYVPVSKLTPEPHTTDPSFQVCSALVNSESEVKT